MRPLTLSPLRPVRLVASGPEASPLPRALFLLTLFAFGLTLVESRPLPRSQSTASWTERWSDLANWSTITQNRCYIPMGGYVEAICQSAGLLSNQSWSSQFPLSLSATVQAAPAAGSSGQSYWAGLTLINDNGYVEIEEVGDYPPQSLEPPAVAVSNTFTRPPGAQDGRLAPYVTWSVHRLSVRWRPDLNTTTYCMDSVCRSIQTPIGGSSLRVETVVTSVLPATPNNGSSAHAVIGPLAVEGVPV